MASASAKRWKVDEHVAAQQQRLGTLGAGHLQRKRAVLGELIEALIVAGPRLGHVKPAQLLQEWARLWRFPDAALSGLDVAIKLIRAGMRAHRDLVGHRGPQFRVSCRRLAGERCAGVERYRGDPVHIFAKADRDS